MRENKFRYLIKAILFLLVLCVIPNQLLAEKFPSKPIKIIMPRSPGGGGDTSLRILSASMEKILGVPVVVKNMPAARGVTGMTAVWRAKPDGHTLCMFYLQHAIGLQLYRNVEFDVKKLSVVGQYVMAKATIGVAKNGKYKSFQDMKNSKKPVRFCIHDYTTNYGIAALAIGKSAGFPVTFVSGYKGAAPSVVGVIKGEGDAAMFGATMKRFFDSGDLVPVLALNKTRYDAFPNVPTMNEVGLPASLSLLTDLNYVIWAPPNTPKERLKIIEKAMFKATEENKEKYKKKFYFPELYNGEEMKNLVDKSFDMMNSYQSYIKEYREKN